MGAIGAMLMFQMFILIFVGVGRLDYREYNWLLPGLLVQNLVQIVGLAIYAVRSLFSNIVLKD